MPTEDTRAAALFADMLLPLGHANRRRGIAYLDRGPRRQSYWSGVVSRTGGLAQLNPSACDAGSILASLGDYWARTKEPSLPKLLPRLEELRQELSGAAPSSDGQEPPFTDFVYPLF
ncbi:MAG: hypothetical protein ACLPWF_33240 [Bryobacteraceae bacterium]